MITKSSRYGVEPVIVDSSMLHFRQSIPTSYFPTADVYYPRINAAPSNACPQASNSLRLDFEDHS